MFKPKYINNQTGELFPNLYTAIKTVLVEIFKYHYYVIPKIARYK